VHALLPTIFAALGPVGPVLHSIFGPLVGALQTVLRAIHSVVHNWGLSIIILTIIVRLILMPLTFKQFRSAQSMQALQPKIKELQRKYKGDKRKVQEETMKLYQEYKVNPFASCLPVLLQMPVFICLYYAIKGTKELQLAPFLWIPAGKVITVVPYTFIHGLGKPDPYYILFVLYVVTQMISTELMLTPETDKQQKIIMRLMPLFFVFILFRFPSGLFLYWVTTNIWTIGQQLIIRRTMPKPEALLARASAKPKREGRFMKAMLEAQEAQKAKRGEASGSAGDGAPVRQKAKPKPRPGGSRPVRKGGAPAKRPQKPSGANDGRKRPSS